MDDDDTCDPQAEEKMIREPDNPGDEHHQSEGYLWWGDGDGHFPSGIPDQGK